MPRPNEKSALLTNAGWLIGSRGLDSVLRGGYALLLVGQLGPELYSLFNYGIGWYLSFLPFGLWGMAAVIGREVGRDPGGRGSEAAAGTLGLRLATSWLATLVCLVLAFTAQDRLMQLVCALFALSLFGRSLGVWANEVLIAQGKSHAVFRLQSRMRLFEVGVGSAAVLAGLGLWVLIGIHLASGWLQAFAGFLVVRRSLSSFRPRLERAQALRLGLECVPLAMLQVGNTWLLQGPLVLVGRFFGEHVELGQFALATQIQMLGNNLTTALAAASLPFLSLGIDGCTEADPGFGVWAL